MNRCIATCLVLMISFAAHALPPDPGKSGTLKAAWADLASNDEVKAAKALLALSANPKETLAFLQENLRSVKADPKRVAQLIADLDSEEFAARKAANEELEYYGKYIKSDLEQALASATNDNQKGAVQSLMDRLPKPPPKPVEPPKMGGRGKGIVITTVNGERKIFVDGVDITAPPPPPLGPPAPPAGWVRAVRVVALLEHVGTPEAKRLLETLAAGEADALPTEQAKAALDRWK